MNSTLDAIFGNPTAANVLLFLEAYGEGHANRIATTYGVAVTPIQRQLEKFENNGVLVSRMVGRSRIYTWNPRNPTVKSLREFLRVELEALPEEETKMYYRQRQRPRRSRKPL